MHEITQIKGDEETHPLLSPEDEFADYENRDVSSISGTVAKMPEMLKHEHARSALHLGMKIEQDVGVNPCKFGMLGGTDTHTARTSA